MFRPLGTPRTHLFRARSARIFFEGFPPAFSTIPAVKIYRYIRKMLPKIEYTNSEHIVQSPRSIYAAREGKFLSLGDTVRTHVFRPSGTPPRTSVSPGTPENHLVNEPVYFSETRQKTLSNDIWVYMSEIRRVSDPVARLSKPDLVPGC